MAETFLWTLSKLAKNKATDSASGWHGTPDPKAHMYVYSYTQSRAQAPAAASSHPIPLTTHSDPACSPCVQRRGLRLRDVLTLKLVPVPLIRRPLALTISNKGTSFSDVGSSAWVQHEYKSTVTNLPSLIPKILCFWILVDSRVQCVSVYE